MYREKLGFQIPDLRQARSRCVLQEGGTRNLQQAFDFYEFVLAKVVAG